MKNQAFVQFLIKPLILCTIFLSTIDIAQAQTDTARVVLYHPSLQSQRFHIGLFAVWPVVNMPDDNGNTNLKADLKFIPSFCILPFNKLVAGVFLYPSSYNTFRIKQNNPLIINASTDRESRLFLPGFFAKYYLLNAPKNVFVEVSGAGYHKSRNFLERDSSVETHLVDSVYRSKIFERQLRLSIGGGYSWFSDGLAFEAGLFINCLSRYSLAWSDSEILFASRKRISWSLEPRIGLVYYF
jgi:hypothetical protein